jgi:hypothetical protein
VRAVARRGADSWQEVATGLVHQIRAQIRSQQRSALDEALGDLDCELFLLERRKSGQFSLMSDVFLLVAAGDHLQEVLARLLALPDELAKSIHFRTYVMPALGAVAIPQLTQMLGSREFRPALYPVTPEDAIALAEEAGLDYLRAPLLADAAQVMDLIVRASICAAGYRLRDKRFSTDRELSAAREALMAAQAAVDRVAAPEIRRHLESALALVASEIDGPRDRSLAAQVLRSALEGRESEGARLTHAVTFAALEAELQSRCAPAVDVT